MAQPLLLAQATTPTSSPRPPQRPGTTPPVSDEPKATEPTAETPEGSEENAATPTERPKRRGLFNRATTKPKAKAKRYPIKGSVCNDRTIRGKPVGNVAGKGACGIPNAVRVTELGGVSLSSPALIDCTTAHRLNAWVQNVANPVVGRKGGGLSSMRLLSSYSCRTRNNRPGARLSEHAKGRAVDIGGFTLADGTAFNVLKGWRDATYGPILKKMHKGACGRFGTVLGPNADRYHQDHFHFDTARHRSGSYCR